MKNLHVLPTDKPSRLRYNLSNVLVVTKELYRDYGKEVNQNIYITADEEIKEGDWYLIEFNGLKITQCTSTEELISIEGRNDCKKIILTTDQDLIADGVQPIDDEFLEWFVKNPSCEYIKTEKWLDDEGGVLYSRIIPKEEPKQEQMKRAKTDWVFWVQIEKRDWFKPVWRSRGANSLNIHFYGYHISIGMPWLQTAVDAYERDGSTSVETTNQANREGIKTHGRFRFITK